MLRHGSLLSRSALGVLLLAAPTVAQSLALAVQAYGSASGVNTQYVEQFQVYAVQVSDKQAEVVVTGGAPGFDVGVVVGSSSINVPILGATLLANPEFVFFFAKFDQTGTARLSFPMFTAKGQRFFVQAIQVGVVAQSLVVAMSEGLRVEAVAATPRSTKFDRQRAITLMQLAYDVYEWKSGNGPIKVGQRLIGDFRVLRKIKTPNPSSQSKWFNKLGWPDTQLMVVRNSSGDVGVVFRGTDPTKASDWVSDIMFSPSNGFHGGFLLAYGSVHNELSNYLPKIVDKHARVYFCGHSLGGALAPVAAYHQQPGLVNLGVAKDDIITYAFAGPRAMTPSKALEFANRVPHHFVVENKDDMVTHVPLPAQGFAHIPRMQVLYPRGAKIALDGADYKSHGVPGPVTHTQDTYLKRLENYLGMPTVSLSVSSSGYMQLNRSWPGRQDWGLDSIGLFKGDPRTNGTQSASVLASRNSPVTTTKPKGPNYYAAYVHEYKTENLVIAVAGPYTWGTPGLSMTKSTLGFVTVNWKMKDPGANDFIALYNKDPRNATLVNRLGTANATKSSRSWTTLQRWKAGLWAAYVERETVLESGRFAKIIGPTK